MLMSSPTLQDLYRSISSISEVIFTVFESMNTDRLKKFLGEDYEKVIRHTVVDAFSDSFSRSKNVSPEPVVAR